MISTLVNLVILLVVGGLVYWLVTLLPLPAPVKQIVTVLMILILIIVLLSMLFGGLPMHRWAP